MRTTTAIGAVGRWAIRVDTLPAMRWKERAKRVLPAIQGRAYIARIAWFGGSVKSPTRNFITLWP